MSTRLKLISATHRGQVWVCLFIAEGGPLKATKTDQKPPNESVITDKSRGKTSKL